MTHRAIRAVVAAVASFAAAVTIGAASAGVASGAESAAPVTVDAVYQHYSGPYGTYESCEATRPGFHNPDDGFYAVWPCYYGYHYGPGWYFYYRYVDDSCAYCAPNRTGRDAVRAV